MVEGCDQIKAIGGYFELADKDCEYASMPVEGVEKLVEFMKKFEAENK